MSAEKLNSANHGVQGTLKMAKKIFTTGEVARLLGININTVIKWFDEKRLTGFRLPVSNERRIPISSLRRFMAENSIPMDLLNEDTPMRRMHTRVLCRETANVVVANGQRFGPYDASILDLSAGGARLRLKGDQALSMPLGKFDLFVSVTEGPLNGAVWTGNIVHLRPESDGLSVGMAFATLELTEKERLTQFIEKNVD